MNACTDCVAVHANGTLPSDSGHAWHGSPTEYQRHPDATPIAQDALYLSAIHYRHPGLVDLYPFGDGPSFSTLPCDVCGSTFHGDRYTVAPVYRAVRNPA